MFPPQQWALMNNARGVAITHTALWDETVDGEPGKIGVPYKINDTFTSQQKKRILAGMKEIEDATCIRYTNKYQRKYCCNSFVLNAN